MLAQDPHVQFERASDGPWTLRDKVTGTVYRSGQDDTPPTNTDVAYLGRLPRPDGDGSLIVFTGIHPQGSLGVVQTAVALVTYGLAPVLSLEAFPAATSIETGIHD